MSCKKCKIWQWEEEKTKAVACRNTHGALQCARCATSRVWHLRCGVAFVQFVISLVVGDGKIFLSHSKADGMQTFLLKSWTLGGAESSLAWQEGGLWSHLGCLYFWMHLFPSEEAAQTGSVLSLSWPWGTFQQRHMPFSSATRCPPLLSSGTAGAVAHLCLWSLYAEERGWSEVPVLWGGERVQPCAWESWWSRKRWKCAVRLSGWGYGSSPGLRQSCSPASGAQRLLAVLAGCASCDDREGWPQKVEGDVEHVPQTVLPSSCGTAAMQDVDVRRIFWLCTVACLVFRSALQKRGLKFVTLYRCVQILCGHGCLWCSFAKDGAGGKMCGGEQALGRKQAHWVGGQRLPCPRCCPCLLSAASWGSRCCFWGLRVGKYRSQMNVLSSEIRAY